MKISGTEQYLEDVRFTEFMTAPAMTNMPVSVLYVDYLEPVYCSRGFALLCNTYERVKVNCMTKTSQLEVLNTLNASPSLQSRTPIKC